MPTGRPVSWAISSTNSISPSTSENAECAGGLTQSSPAGTQRIAAISGVTFTPGSSPPRPGLAPWESLTSIARTGACATMLTQTLKAETAVRVAAAEIPGADLQHELSAVAVRTGEAALAGVVQAAGEPRATVESLHGDRRERAVAHARQVHQRRRAKRVAAAVAGAQHLAGRDPVVGCTAGLPGRRGGRGKRRVLDDEQALDGLHLIVGAEPEHVLFALRGSVDPTPLITRERALLVVGGDDVLTQLGAERLEQRSAGARGSGSCAGSRAGAEAGRNPPHPRARWRGRESESCRA